MNILLSSTPYRAVCLILAALILTGCPKRVRVSERVVLERAPELGGTAADILNAKNFADTNHGLRLKPGDVIYLTRWYPGTLDPKDQNQKNYHWVGPQSYTERIPLRYVRGPKPALYPYEQEFLGDVLSVNRSEEFRKVTADQAAILRTKEVALWNSLVDSIKVKRIPYKTGTPCQADCNLVLTISRSVLLGPLSAEEKPLFLPEEDDTGTEFELMALVTPYGSMPDALTGKGLGNPADNEAYYSRNSRTGYRSRFHFVTVELNGVNVNRLQWPERAWTLRAWEQSGVCRASDLAGNVVETEIKNLSLIGSGTSFRISRSGSKTVNYDVRVILDNTRRTREVVPNEHADPFEHGVLSDDALDMLYMEDVRKIKWQSPIPAQKKAEVINRSNCSFR